MLSNIFPILNFFIINTFSNKMSYPAHDLYMSYPTHVLLSIIFLKLKFVILCIFYTKMCYPTHFLYKNILSNKIYIQYLLSTHFLIEKYLSIIYSKRTFVILHIFYMKMYYPPFFYMNIYYRIYFLYENVVSNIFYILKCL